MSATWNGIPLASAIIVRHTPNEGKTSHGRPATGAISCTRAREAAYYIARKGRYADRGDIDRAATRDDVKLARSPAAWALDYASRRGAFAAKGADRQVDASLWGPEGPLDADEVAREMEAAGGAFVDSVVSVKREHAAALGLTGKDDFERMMRATWARNAEQWELTVKDDEGRRFLGKAFADASDIRWCAAFHTDAQMGLHCHIYTWSAEGGIPERSTVTEKSTARAKEEVLRYPYAHIRRERDLRATYLRDVSIEAAKRELGLPIERSRLEALGRRAARFGWEERVPDAPGMPQPARERAGELMDALAMELAAGDGRLARNWRAQAAARDLIELVEAESPSSAALKAERERLSDAKCDLKGLSKEGPEREGAMRRDREDAKGRMARAICRAMAPRETVERELRPDLRPLDMRGREGWGNVSFSRKLIVSEDGGVVTVRMPRRPGEGEIRVEIPLEAAADINRGSGKLAAIELGGAYRATAQSGEARDMAGVELVRRLGRADMPRIARMNPDEGQDARRQAERARRLARERAMAALGMGGRVTAERVSARYGTTLADGKAIMRQVRRAERLRERDPERARRERAQAAKMLVERSPRMRDAVNRRARQLEAAGVPWPEAKLRVEGKAVEAAASALEREGAASPRAHSAPIPLGAGGTMMMAAVLEASIGAAGDGAEAPGRERGRRIGPQRGREAERERPM